MLGNIGLCPMYSYEKDKNIILLRLKRPKRNPLISLLGSVIMALAVGFAGRMLLPDAFIGATLEKLVEPVYDTFLGVLGSIAGPMVFLAVAWGIYSIGDLIPPELCRRLHRRFPAVEHLFHAAGYLSR